MSIECYASAGEERIGRHLPRAATCAVVRQDGSQRPVCEKCAQHEVRNWGARLMPLSSYVDPWETAQQQAATDQAFTDLGAAFMRIPENSVRRIASGVPAVLDLQLLDQEMPEASLTLLTGGSGAAERAEAIAAAKKAGHPSPIQDIAWLAVRGRGLSHRAPSVVTYDDGVNTWTVPQQQTYSAMGFARDGQPRKPLSPKAKLLWIVGSALASLVLGIVLVTWEPDTAPGAATPILWGIFFILVGVAIPVIALIVAVAKDSAGQHRAWLDSKPPSQQAPIVRAEKAALWAATSVAAVALHESNKRESERQRAQQAARQQAWTEQQRHQELLSAIRQSGQPQGPDPMTAAALRTLERSRARRPPAAGS